MQHTNFIRTGRRATAWAMTALGVLFLSAATDRATAGDWTGTGRDGVGLVRGAYWYQSAAVTNGVDRIFWY